MVVMIRKDVQLQLRICHLSANIPSAQLKLCVFLTDFNPTSITAIIVHPLDHNSITMMSHELKPFRRYTNQYLYFSSKVEIKSKAYRQK